MQVSAFMSNHKNSQQPLIRHLKLKDVDQTEVLAVCYWPRKAQHN